MKLLLVSNDPKVLDEQSFAFARMKAYAKHVDELHIVMRFESTFTKRSDNIIIHAVKSTKPMMFFVLPPAIQKIIRTKNIEFVSAQDPFEFGLIALIGTHKTKAKLTIQLHTDYLSKWFTASFPMGKVNIVRQIIASYVLPRACNIRVVSKRIKDSLIKKFGTNIVEPDILPIAVERTIKRGKVGGKENVLVSVSRLEEEKRVEDTIRAFATTRITRPEWKLKILNEGRKSKALRALTASLGIADAVEFVGYQREPQTYIDDAEIFIQTSSYEGYGMALIEAALIGTPIITTNVGVVGEILHNGTDILSAPVGDVEELAKHMETLMGDRGLRQELAGHAHASASRLAKYFDDTYAREVTDVLTTTKERVKKPKLAYILPHAKSSTHMRFNVEALVHLSERVDLFVIIEKGEAPSELSGIARVREVRSRNVFIRILKTKWYLLEARANGFDKVYVHYSFIGAFLASLIPFMRTYYWNCGLPWQYKRGGIEDAFQRLVYRMISHLVTGSASLASEYAKQYGFPVKKALIIPNWIDVESFAARTRAADRKQIRKELGIDAKATVLFFVQRLAQRKGAHYIPDILARTPSDTVMIITSDGPYKQELIDTLKSRELYSRVRILGSVNNDAMPELFAASDIFILPSEEEGMSHALLEAFAAPLPAVAYAAGATREMYPDTAQEYVVPVGDMEGFCTRVNELIKYKGRRVTLAQSEFAKVQEYNKAKVLGEFYEKLVL
jgi:glycosyltransferase involved in cell wall biosynthesis